MKAVIIMMTFLKGKFTYIMAGVAVLYGAYAYSSGMLDHETSLQIIWAGLTVFGVRRAISQ